MSMVKESKPRRNDLCPCGSGKKFKDCCMFVGQQPMLTVESIKYMKKKIAYLKKHPVPVVKPETVNTEQKLDGVTNDGQQK